MKVCIVKEEEGKAQKGIYLPTYAPEEDSPLALAEWQYCNVHK